MAASVTALQAHPGHAPLSEGAKHFVTSPNHFLPALLFAAAVCAAAQLLNNRGERNFVRAIAALIVFAAAVG